ncbi:hypothetical protein INR77_03175 [Erythrobacter sp. SCSIO 43205]|uniref:hypothetical protein n=1 Tax=Erythrobacter sp. SCSIO 43205 TaxID=2779361 RepID=UPI001CA98949|nr:hypothetical protein [Erythrobacter sp. SCSIO 43205]UAB78743.1 hypothetical protein INR77_03175 [Erythrobacter sp. SCSIO 43205]
MAEERRLKIAKRQLLLAQIARREARFALANAIAEEERSADIKARANELLSEYSRRSGEPTNVRLGQSLSRDLAFIHSLQKMSDTAAQAHEDAREQAAFQMRTLAAAETKMSAHEERVAGEKRALADLKAKRELPSELTTPAKVARKLHKGSATPD